MARRERAPFRLGDRVSDRGFHMAEQARSAIWPKEDHTLRNVLSFAAGMGLGIGAGILLAPASGAEIRSSISNRVKDISNVGKRRVPTEARVTATGTGLL